MENQCFHHDRMEKRLCEIEDDVSDLKIQTKLDSQKFTMLLENLAQLPEAITDMKNSLILMNNEIRSSGEKTESLEKKLDKLDAKVSSIDEDGKFSILKVIKQNFIAIVMFASGISLWAANFLKN